MLAVIEAAGYAPRIIDYLREGWTQALLLTLFAAAGLSARQALRETKSPAEELGLLAQGVSQERMIAEMTRHPILVQRPFVATPKGVRLCRPSEIVLDLLERWPKGPFSKEDGALLIEASGKRATA